MIRLTNLETEKIGPVLWRLTDDLDYVHYGKLLSVPESFISDGASCPKILWSLCSPMSGPQAEAAIMHDYMYSLDSDYDYTRKEVDDMFLEAMLAEGTGKMKARLIWAGVRAGGSGSFKKCHSIDKIKV